MITLLGNEVLPNISTVSFAFTDCLICAFSGSPLAPEVWLQKEEDTVTAVISRFGGRVNLSYLGGNTDEIKEFLNVIGFSELFCEENTAKALGFENYDSFKVLKATTKKEKDFISPVALNSLYEGLSFGADGEVALPPFEIFAPDVSHRLRHGGSVAIVENYGAALAFCGNRLNVINGIAIKQNLRGTGLGKKLLLELTRYLEGDVFALAAKDSANFYIKNGFLKTDTAVIIRG